MLATSPLLEPARWVVRQIAHLPDLVRPSLFLALIVLVVAFVVFQSGLRRLWNGALRAVAVAVDASIGLVLLPEYAVTRHRRAQGQAPGARVLAMGRVADETLFAASALHRRHPPLPAPSRLPWIVAAAVFAACSGAWLAMMNTPGDSAPARTLSATFDRWLAVERWAGVAPARMAVAGPGIRGEGVARHYVELPRAGTRLTPNSRGTITIDLGRARDDAEAMAVIRSESGSTLGSKAFAIVAGESSVARVTLAPAVRRSLRRHGTLPATVTVRIKAPDGTRAAAGDRYTLAAR